MTGRDCGKRYIGKTGWNFKVRYEEHMLLFRNFNNSSNFAQHLLENSHVFSKSDDIMNILFFNNKGTHLDTLENFYI